MRLVLLLAAYVGAMNNWQRLVARKVMSYRAVPAFSTITDSVIFDELAYTDQTSYKVYADAARFVNASNTWTNVMIHECGHLLGAQHGDGSLGMQYAVTLDVLGNVVNDGYLLADISTAPFLSLPESHTLGSLLSVP